MYNGQALEMMISLYTCGHSSRTMGAFWHHQILADQARKSMFAVLRKCRKLYLPVDIQLQLVDSILVPVLLYASEVSGFESCDILERLCIQFYKISLRAKILFYMGNLGGIPLVLQLNPE